jgi:hypothetical protein
MIAMTTEPIVQITAENREIDRRAASDRMDCPELTATTSPTA